MPAAVLRAEAQAKNFQRNWHVGHGRVRQPGVVPPAAMGLGLGSLVDESAPPSLGGLSYVEFLAGGLVAATAVQFAGTEGTFPVMHGTTWGAPTTPCWPPRSRRSTSPSVTSCGSASG